jgi:hypothetical protein
VISITDYLELIYTDFKNEIDGGRYLCDLKDLTFESNHLPDYNNIQIQRLYLLRYAFSYGFEYSHIYAKALARLDNPDNVAVASIGCGNFLDYWALVKAVEKREQDEVYFKEGNVVKFFEENEEFISDIYFFPKSISEFGKEEMKIIVDNFKSKPIIKDKIILCFSIRANEYSRDRDMSKTKQIVKALEENGYMQNNEKNVISILKWVLIVKVNVKDI